VLAEEEDLPGLPKGHPSAETKEKQDD